MHLTMRAMNEFHRAAVAGTTTNALSMRARSACSNHLPCRVVNTLHQIPHANPTLQGVSQTSVRGRPGRLAPNPLRSLHDQPELSFLICRGDGVSDHRAGKADRKSTRLNSSHSQISYAVFCLKKKTQLTKQARSRCPQCCFHAARAIPPVRAPNIPPRGTTEPAARSGGFRASAHYHRYTVMKL